MEDLRVTLFDLYGINYREESHNVNKELVDVLERLRIYIPVDQLRNTIKEIFIHLCQQVDDSEYFDLGYYNDCEDIIDILHEYYTSFEVNGSEFVLQLLEYCTVNEGTFLIDSYETLHKLLLTAMYVSTDQDEDEDYINYILLLNEIVDNEVLATYNKMYNSLLYGN